MTCERYERDLALAVEGDLPEREGAHLERHVQRCPRCQAFLQGLKDSQRRLKLLSTETVDDAALATVRTRVLAAFSETARPSWVVPAWGWALAVSLAVVALGLARVVLRTRNTLPPRAAGLVAASPTPRPGPPAALVPAETATVMSKRRSAGGASTPRAHLSTVRQARSVSQGMEPDTARIVPGLSPDDAAQLAKAVVAVSRIRRLGDRPPAGPAEPSPAVVVRLETSDPRVVIYWQLDSNGG